MFSSADAKDVLASAENILGIGYWHHDLATNRITWSDQVYAILGYQPGEIELSLEFIESSIAETDRAEFIKCVDLAIKQGSPYHLELKIKTRSGGSKLIRTSGQPNTDDQGKVVKLIGLIQDISVESERLNYLLESQKLLEAASSIASIGHWRLDLIDHDLYWSDEVYRIHGFEPGEIRPNLDNALDFYHPDDRERVSSVVERSMGSGEPFSFQARVVRPDGSVRQVLSRGLVHSENGISTVLFGVFQDISDQIDNQEQSLMWSYLVNESPEAIIITDASGRVIWVNQACETLTGYSLEEMKGLKPGALLQGPDTDAETARKLGQAVNSREPITVEILNYSKLGEPYWVMISIFPRFDDNAELQQFMAIEIDVTERVESQQKLAQKQKELEKTNFQIDRQRAAAEDLVRKEALVREQLEGEIEKSRGLQEQLRKMANQDTLTGIPNRRYFLKRAEAELQRAKRYQHPLSLIMCDIDHFKQVNDNYGHHMGDEALRNVTATMALCLRDNIDLIGRMGGEEFCIALPETGLPGAEKVAERLRHRIANTPISDAVSVTCSFGVTSIESTDSLELAMSRADSALYESKTGGRNRVTIYTG
ncbi:MAG: diguanylate cyclase [Gammaproteobacteria bacterium]|nr:diguanylate cyclase [Gammaproteobacteria bacterium]